jgi:ABC-type transporter Mla subunit MlaD
MAGKARNEIAVGITVLVVLSLTIYIVVMLADWSSISTAQQEITIRVPYKDGLRGLSKGSPVNLGGVKIGVITKTEISKPATTDMDGIYVSFTMKIPQEYQLRRDCVLLPECNVLGGQPSLCIRDLGSEGEVVRDGEMVELALASSVMDAIKQEFDSADPESLLALVKYEVNRDNDDSVVSSLKNVAAEIEKAIPAITEEIQKTLVKAQTALDTAQLTLQNVKDFTDDERIDKIISDFTEVGTNLKLTSQEVRRAPWKLLYKPKEKEFKIQSLVDSAGSFAAGAESLNTSALRLQAMIAEADEKELIDKQKLEAMISELEVSFSQFQKAERKFWEELE